MQQTKPGKQTSKTMTIHQKQDKEQHRTQKTTNNKNTQQQHAATASNTQQ